MLIILIKVVYPVFLYYTLRRQYSVVVKNTEFRFKRHKFNFQSCH